MMPLHSGTKGKDIADAKESLGRQLTTIFQLETQTRAHDVDIDYLQKDIAADLYAKREANEVRVKETPSSRKRRLTLSSAVVHLRSQSSSPWCRHGQGGQFLRDRAGGAAHGVAADVRRVLHKSVVPRPNL